MDIYCVKCGEPWDLDCLHEEAEERVSASVVGEPYAAVFKRVRSEFASVGCAALAGAYGASVADQCKASASSRSRAQLSAVAFDLMGDDIDDVASMMDDAERLGLF